MHIETIGTESLGNRGYLVHDGAVAVAIDVQRDYSRWLEAAKTAGVSITHVLETHMHNDYVTGGYQLARKSGALYAVPAQSGVSFSAHELRDNESFSTGMLQVTSLHTPGHTEHHMSYLVSDGTTNAVFTGGGILYGTVGRTDLVAKDKTQDLTYAQYDSAQRLGVELPDQTAVFPTHGFGSFCSSADGSGATESTMETEKRSNVVFTSEREAFVAQIIAGLGPYPRYYAYMGPANQAGPEEVTQLHIHEYSAEEMWKQLNTANVWVIDIRSRKLFAAHHPKGAVGIELGNSFATYTGWIVPWSDTLLLVGETKEELVSAHMELSRIGMDGHIGGATDSMPSYFEAGPASNYRVAGFSDLASVIADEPYVLDVRLDSDWKSARVRSSYNIPLHELLGRIEEIPSDREVWVHCASGYRASIAAALLDKEGKLPVLIDDAFENAEQLNLTTNQR